MPGNRRFGPAFFFVGIVLVLFPAIFVLHQWETGSVRVDAEIRAGWLARAVWLRLEDARREIPGVLVKTNWQGKPAAAWVPMPWFDGRVSLIRDDKPVLPLKETGTTRAPVWVLPEKESGFFFARTDRSSVSPRLPVIGLDAFLLGQSPVKGLQLSPDTGKREQGPVDGRIFFERQRRLDALAREVDALAGLGDRDAASALQAFSDGVAMYVQSRGLPLPTVLYGEYSALSAAGHPDGQVRIVCGHPDTTGAVVVDRAIETIPAWAERILLVAPVGILALALFLTLRPRMSERSRVLILAVTVLVSSWMLWDDVRGRQDARIRGQVEYRELLLTKHAESGAVIARAAPSEWKAFPLLASSNLGHSGDTGLPLLILSSLLPGAILVIFLRRLENPKVCAVHFMSLVPLVLVSGIFLHSLVDAFPAWTTSADGGGTGFLLLMFAALSLQTVLAIPVVIAWTHMGKAWRSVLLALGALPLAVPLAFQDLLASGERLPWNLAEVFLLVEGYPLVVVAMLMARTRIPFTVRQALALECGSVWRRFWSLDLWVCLLGAVPAWAISAWLVLLHVEAAERPPMPLLIAFSLLLLGVALRVAPHWIRRGGTMEDS